VSDLKDELKKQWIDQTSRGQRFWWGFLDCVRVVRILLTIIVGLVGVAFLTVGCGWFVSDERDMADLGGALRHIGWGIAAMAVAYWLNPDKPHGPMDAT